MAFTRNPTAHSGIVRRTGRVLTWIAHALVVGLIVAAFAFGGPDDNDAARADGIELDAHSDGSYDDAGTTVETATLGD